MSEPKHLNVGRDIPHDSAIGHVTGESIYVDDMPFARNELLVDFVGSPYAHGLLLSLDLEAARLLPGIVGLFTVADLPGPNCLGPITHDEVLLVEREATYLNQPIVVIAGETRAAIRKAKTLIHIEMEALQPVFTIDEAKAKGQFIGPTRTIERGSVDNAFENPECYLQGTFRNGGQEHFYLESQACIAYPGEFETITLHSSTQHPSEVQRDAAEILGIPHKNVVCITKRMGGAFGGKESQATHPAVMAALVALKTKRPARFAIDKDSDMSSTGKRHPFQNDYRVAFTKDGLITALVVDLFSDGGAANDLSTAVMGRAMCHAENAYFIPNIRLTGTICRTNFPPNTAFRGFGGPQGIVNIENIIEEIAAYLQKDSYEIRCLNCYGVEDRNTTSYGQYVADNMLPELLETLYQRANYSERRVAVARFNRTSATHLKGLSLTPIKFGISFNTRFLNQANALVNVFLDGTIQVSTGGTEMGQGLNTKIRQLVADAFAIDVAQVLLMPTSTEKNHNTSATAASSGTDLNGAAALDACEKIRQRLTEAAARYLAFPEEAMPPSELHIVWEDGAIYDTRNPENRLCFQTLVKKAYLDRVNMGERGFYATQGVDFTWEAGLEKTGKGTPFLYFTTGCALSEVLIDRFTGELKVLRSDLLMDIGRSINPGIDRGQIAGAFVQGMGWVTSEELRYGPDGTLLTHSPTTYKIPSIQDIPEIFNIDWIENDRNEVNLKRSKAVGEPPLMLAISVWTAVKHALSFLAPPGSVTKLDLPATGEEILKRLTELKKVQPESFQKPALKAKAGNGMASTQEVREKGSHPVSEPQAD